MKHATSYLFKDTYSNFYCLDILMAHNQGFSL